MRLNSSASAPELVTARALDPHVEGTGADLRRRRLDRLDRTHEPADEKDAGDAREEQEGHEEERRPPDR